MTEIYVRSDRRKQAQTNGVLTQYILMPIASGLFAFAGFAGAWIAIGL